MHVAGGPPAYMTHGCLLTLVHTRLPAPPLPSPFPLQDFGLTL